MKFPFITRWKKQLIFSVFAFFIICQIGGFFFLSSQFIRFKVNSLLPELQTVASEVAASGDLPTKPIKMLLRVVDNNGTIVLPESVRLFTLNAFWPNVLQRLENHDYYANVHQIPELDSQSLILVVPLVNSEQFIVGVAPIGDLRSALTGFTIVFSFIFVVASSLIALLLYFYHRETQHLLNLQKTYVETMTHELKTPITAIRALTETLQDGIISDETIKNDYLTIIHAENQKLATLVNDSLALAAIQSLEVGAVELNQFAIYPSCQQFFATYRTLAQAKNFDFEIAESFIQLVPVKANQHYLEQVFALILDNAFKFCYPNGTISLFAKKTPTHVTIYLRNNGPMIPEHIVPLLFDRFAKTATADNPDGSGLGLAIAKETLNLIGGKLELFESTPEQTTFAITLQRR